MIEKIKKEISTVSAKLMMSLSDEAINCLLKEHKDLYACTHASLRRTKDFIWLEEYELWLRKYANSESDTVTFPLGEDENDAQARLDVLYERTGRVFKGKFNDKWLISMFV